MNIEEACFEEGGAWWEGSLKVVTTQRASEKEG